MTERHRDIRLDAVFPGDSVETKPGFAAHLDPEASVLIQTQFIVKFEGIS